MNSVLKSYFKASIKIPGMPVCSTNKTNLQDIANYCWNRC